MTPALFRSPSVSISIRRRSRFPSAIPVCRNFPGIFRDSDTASRISGCRWSDRNARIPTVRGAGFTGGDVMMTKRVRITGLRVEIPGR